MTTLSSQNCLIEFDKLSSNLFLNDETKARIQRLKELENLRLQGTGSLPPPVTKDFNRTNRYGANTSSNLRSTFSGSYGRLNGSGFTGGFGYQSNFGQNAYNFQLDSSTGARHKTYQSLSSSSWDQNDSSQKTYNSIPRKGSSSSLTLDENSHDVPSLHRSQSLNLVTEQDHSYNYTRNIPLQSDHDRASNQLGQRHSSFDDDEDNIEEFKKSLFGDIESLNKKMDLHDSHYGFTSFEPSSLTSVSSPLNFSSKDMSPRMSRLGKRSFGEDVGLRNPVANVSYQPDQELLVISSYSSGSQQDAIENGTESVSNSNNPHPDTAKNRGKEFKIEDVLGISVLENEDAINKTTENVHRKFLEDVQDKSVLDDTVVNAKDDNLQEMKEDAEENEQVMNERNKHADRLADMTVKDIADISKTQTGQQFSERNVEEIMSASASMNLDPSVSFQIGEDGISNSGSKVKLKSLNQDKVGESKLDEDSNVQDKVQLNSEEEVQKNDDCDVESKSSCLNSDTTDTILQETGKKNGGNSELKPSSAESPSKLKTFFNAILHPFDRSPTKQTPEDQEKSESPVDEMDDIEEQIAIKSESKVYSEFKEKIAEVCSGAGSEESFETASDVSETSKKDSNSQSKSVKILQNGNDSYLAQMENTLHVKKVVDKEENFQTAVSAHSENDITSDVKENNDRVNAWMENNDFGSSSILEMKLKAKNGETSSAMMNGLNEEDAADDKMTNSLKFQKGGIHSPVKSASCASVQTFPTKIDKSTQTEEVKAVTAEVGIQVSTPKADYGSQFDVESAVKSVNISTDEESCVKVVSEQENINMVQSGIQEVPVIHGPNYSKPSLQATGAVWSNIVLAGNKTTVTTADVKSVSSADVLEPPIKKHIQQQAVKIENKGFQMEPKCLDSSKQNFNFNDILSRTVVMDKNEDEDVVAKNNANVTLFTAKPFKIQQAVSNSKPKFLSPDLEKSSDDGESSTSEPHSVIQKTSSTLGNASPSARKGMVITFDTKKTKTQEPRYKTPPALMPKAKESSMSPLSPTSNPPIVSPRSPRTPSKSPLSPRSPRTKNVMNGHTSRVTNQVEIKLTKQRSASVNQEEIDKGHIKSLQDNPFIRNDSKVKKAIHGSFMRRCENTNCRRSMRSYSPGSASNSQSASLETVNQGKYFSIDNEKLDNHCSIGGTKENRGLNSSNIVDNIISSAEKLQSKFVGENALSEMNSTKDDQSEYFSCDDMVFEKDTAVVTMATATMSSPTLTQGKFDNCTSESNSFTSVIVPKSPKLRCPAQTHENTKPQQEKTLLDSVLETAKYIDTDDSDSNSSPKINSTQDKSLSLHDGKSGIAKDAERPAFVSEVDSSVDVLPVQPIPPQRRKGSIKKGKKDKLSLSSEGESGVDSKAKSNSEAHQTRDRKKSPLTLERRKSPVTVQKRNSPVVVDRKNSSPAVSERRKSIGRENERKKSLGQENIVNSGSKEKMSESSAEKPKTKPPPPPKAPKPKKSGLSFLRGKKSSKT